MRHCFMRHNRLIILIQMAVLAIFLSGCGFTAIKLHPDVPVVTSAEPDFPKAIVVYDSWSGNTGLVAEVIAAKLAAPAVHVDQIGEYALEDYDLFVVGSPVHGGRPTAKIKTFLSGLPKPALSAVFVTFGAPLFGPLTANACLNKMEKSLQGTSLGRFKCHGFHKVFRTYPSHPGEKDKDEAARFAAEILNRCRNPESSRAEVTE